MLHSLRIRRVHWLGNLGLTDVPLFKMPPRLCEWTNRKWPELIRYGGLEVIDFWAVDRLPFFAPFGAMAWKGAVLVNRSFLGPEAVRFILENGYLDDSNLRHVSLLAFREPLHYMRAVDNGWRWYLLDYIWEALRSGLSYQHYAKEKQAHNYQEVLTNNFRMENPFGNLRGDKRIS